MKLETMSGDIFVSYLGHFHEIWRFETSLVALLDFFKGVSLWIWVEIFLSLFFFQFRPGIYFGDFFTGFKSLSTPFKEISNFSATITFPKMLDYDFQWKFQFFKRFSYGNNVWVIV